MPRIVPIVEGDGEVTAVPVLLTRILHAMGRYDLYPTTPKNAHGRGNLTSPGGLERFVRYAARERDCGAVLLLIDADQDCPVVLARGLADRVRAMGLDTPVVIVCAKHMYEAWLLASIETIRGCDLQGRTGIAADASIPDDPEGVGNAKSWLDRSFPRGRAYKETEDQEAMTRLLNFDLAKNRSRSFVRLWTAVEQALDSIDKGVVLVTPE